MGRWQGRLGAIEVDVDLGGLDGDGGWMDTAKQESKDTAQMAIDGPKNKLAKKYNNVCFDKLYSKKGSATYENLKDATNKKESADSELVVAALKWLYANCPSQYEKVKKDLPQKYLDAEAGIAWEGTQKDVGKAVGEDKLYTRPLAKAYKATCLDTMKQSQYDELSKALDGGSADVSTVKKSLEYLNDFCPSTSLAIQAKLPSKYLPSETKAEVEKKKSGDGGGGGGKKPKKDTPVLAPVVEEPPWWKKNWKILAAGGGVLALGVLGMLLMGGGAPQPSLAPALGDGDDDCGCGD